MRKHKCIRTCFVNNVLWNEGNIYELSNEMEKSPKNFKPLDESLPPEPLKEPELIIGEATPEPEKPVENNNIKSRNKRKRKK